MIKQLRNFWRELLVPFHPHEFSVKKVGGRGLTYIDKRSLANRLDSVDGPDGWFTEHRDEGGRGLVYGLHLRIPMDNGSWSFMHKEMGVAHEGMVKKIGGDRVEELDNDFKPSRLNLHLILVTAVARHTKAQSDRPKPAQDPRVVISKIEFYNRDKELGHGPGSEPT
ncbi:hypothetical protein [Paludisphaera borealis]|nr:hypothetical protein [Paludisphaera borealis]